MLHQPRQRRFIKMRDLLIEREAMVLQLFFIEELNLQEIGTMMGVGAARICQIKKAALGKLRFRLEQAL
jgi:RNA polymerase sigma factor for flagellar operon FliA